MRKKIRYRNAQQESEYGSACLAMLADYYGKYISLFQAAQVCDERTRLAFNANSERTGRRGSYRLTCPVL